MNCCGGSKFVKYIWVLIGLIILACVIFSFVSHSKGEVTNEEPQIKYYTCGMHPSVKVSLEEYNKGKVNCPICNMKLTPVYKEEAKKEKIYYGCGVDTEGRCPRCDLGKPDERCICGEHTFIIEGQKINCPVCNKPLRELTREEADKLRGVVSRVKIKGGQATLAGVATEPVKKLHLFKEIRTVGKVAYDPQLAIAQEEFISALKALDKIKKGEISEIKERAQKLLDASKRKLKLLGLSDEQIEELEKTRKIQTSLILPEEKMWIYGDIYEYELGWVKVGGRIKVTTSSLPGEEFSGIISSVNPVLDPKTRSVTFRAQVNNPDLKLKPEMYVDVVIMSMYMSPEGEHMVLAIPRDAVLDTGMRKIVWVDLGNGEFQGREVKVGPEATAEIDGKRRRYLPILNGLDEGELVVTRGNFLVDSQSQLTGQAAAAYGGALEAEEKKTPPVHQH